MATTSKSLLLLLSLTQLACMKQGVLRRLEAGNERIEVAYKTAWVGDSGWVYLNHYVNNRLSTATKLHGFDHGLDIPGSASVHDCSFNKQAGIATVTTYGGAIWTVNLKAGSAVLTPANNKP